MRHRTRNAGMLADGSVELVRALVLVSLLAAAACGGGASKGAPGGTPGGGEGEPPPSGPTSPAAPWAGAPVAAIVADVGPDRSVEAGAHVTLDGTRSRSPAGPIASWSWVQTEGPDVVLTDAAGPRPAFDAPEVGAAGARLSFELTVRDGASSTSAVLHVDLRERDAEPPRTTIGKIRKAMQEGSLDRETALAYLAFAIVDDPRLPSELRGEPSRSASWARAVLSEEFAKTSSETQAVLLPFLLPPGHPDAYQRGSSPGIAAQAVAGDPPVQRSAEGAHVVVWYWSTLQGGAILASDLVTEIEATIWPRLREVWTDAHMPVLADAGVGAAFKGVHGKVNVFLEPLADYGYMQPYGAGPVPTYVVLRQSLPFSGKNPAGLVESAAHELTHSCQYSFHHAETYAGHRFLYEATATWAEDDVYPSHDSEQEYAASFLDHMRLPLDDETDVRPYGAYLLFQAVTRGSGDPTFVRRAFENGEAEPQLAAVDHAFPTAGGIHLGFERYWAAFMDAVWNRNPGESFWGADNLAVGAKAAAPVDIALGASGDASYPMEAEVRHLAARFYRFTVGDPNVRTIHFFDGFTYDLAYRIADGGSVVLTFADGSSPGGEEGAITRMFVKRGDRWTALGWESPSIGDRSICQDTPEEEIQEIAIAYGDSIPERGHSKRPPGEPPLLWVTNIGCDHWEGSVTAHTSPERPDVPQETINATNVLFTRWHPAGIDTGELEFQLASADVSWSISGTVGNCSYAGSAHWRQDSANGPTGGLGFAPTIMSGSAHRMYVASATGVEHPVTYTITCTEDGGSTSVSTATKVVEWLSTYGATDGPRVSADGQRASGSADDGFMAYSWSFESRPGLAPLPVAGARLPPPGGPQ